ncbi:MAG: Acyl--CoA ligase [Actinomycetota bacterium]|nr:Acyl--CoA ligase [Actinomycetota bacterium]
MIRHDLIAQHASARPADLALADQETSLTWAEFAGLVDKATTALSTLLASRPCGNQSRIAFLADSTVEVVVLQAAAATLGVPIVGVDHSLPAEHVAGCIAQIRPAVLAVSPTHRPLADEALGILGNCRTMVTSLGQGVPVGDWLRPSAESTEQVLIRWNKPSFLALGFTSGTSGQPKMIVRTATNDARRHQDIVSTFAVTSKDVYLNTVPLFHASSSGWARIFLTEGAPVVIAGELDAEQMARLAARHRATFSLMVPPVLATYVKVLRTLDDVPVTPFRALVTGGRQVSPALVRDVVERWGHVLHIYYGTTETGLNTLATPADLAEAPTTVGRAFPGNKIAILDPDDLPVERGEVGTVAISGYMIADRFSTPSAPHVVVDEEPFWRTGDSGRLDDKGRLTILGRDQSGRSFDVVGAEAELRELPCVQDVYVQVMSKRGTSSAVAAYVPKDPAADSAKVRRLDERITATVAEVLGIRDVRIVRLPSIPYSPSGKVRPKGILIEVNAA